MAIEVGDLLRVAMVWLMDGVDQCVNVHTFEVDSVGATTDDTDIMVDLADNLLADWYADILSVVANNIVGYLLSGINLSKDEVLPPVPLNIDGGGSGSDALARQVSALCYWSGNEPRRQARTYLPPFIEGALDDSGIWNVGALTGLTNFTLAGLDPLPGDEVVMSKRIGTALIPAVVVPSLAGFSVNPRTQRRRTPGRGA